MNTCRNNNIIHAYCVGDSLGGTKFFLYTWQCWILFEVRIISIALLVCNLSLIPIYTPSPRSFFFACYNKDIKSYTYKPGNRKL